MGSRIILALIAFSLIFIYGCAQTSEKAAANDEPQEQAAIEPVEIVEEEQSENGISPEVKQLLDNSAAKVNSIRYSYKGPETAEFYYKFYVKGSKIKYTLDPSYKVVDVDEEAYDTIYLDKSLKTARAYCDDRTCRVRGQKAVLNYDAAYILTPFDWLGSIKSAEKRGEEQIDRRNAWKLSTNAGTVWVDTFYGVPLQAESSGDLHRFDKISFNNVKDEDVNPSQP